MGFPGQISRKKLQKKDHSCAFKQTDSLRVIYVTATSQTFHYCVMQELEYKYLLLYKVVLHAPAGLILLSDCDWSLREGGLSNARTVPVMKRNGSAPF